MRDYRVVLHYRFKSKRPGVRLGMTIKAKNMDDAMDRAIAQHITPYRSRILIASFAESAWTKPAKGAA